MEDFVFESILSREEFNEKVPADIGGKICQFVAGKFDELITANALHKTNQDNLEKTIAELQESNEALKAENATLEARLQAAAASINEFESQVSNLNAELVKLQQSSNRLEAEAAECRHQRNLAVGERDEAVTLMQRRDAEIERFQLEMSTMTKQLEDAINKKCEALAQADEVASMKLTLEHKEKSLEQVRSLLDGQIESLTAELNERTDELLNMRRDNTSKCIQLEIKLDSVTQELAVAKDQIKSLTELNENLTSRNEELSQRMYSQKETDAKLNESYISEIDAKTKMANAYKSMYEENQQHSKELEEALSEVQELLKKATEEYGKLETQHKEEKLANEEIISKKNEYIAMLKKELETSNEVLNNFHDRSHHDLDRSNRSSHSPIESASASRLVKSGMTFSELYARYVSVSDDNTTKENEIARLNNYIAKIVSEIEDKGPYIKKLRDEYADALDSIDVLKQNNEDLLAEIQQLRDSSSASRRQEGQLSRENGRLKKEVNDLSRQVVHLLQEVEHSRIGSSSTSTDNDLSDSISSADIISKKLVTFNDIGELQSTNQKLLAVVRELTERQEEAESFDPAAIANLQRKLEELRESQNELLEERDQQNKMMTTLRNQKDMYKNLYNQVTKGAGDVPSHIERSMSLENGEKMQTESESFTNVDDKLRDLENQVEKYKKQAEQYKEMHDTYKTEKSENEKILLEHLDKIRAECQELTRQNCQLNAQSDLNQEKFKVLQNNAEIYKKQITALEKKSNIYSEAIVKHEQAATYLKDEAIKCQTALSKAEVKLGNLQKENALLKEKEGRLYKEIEMLRSHSHQHQLLHSNIELIKATIERNDAEGKLRLEAKLDEAHLECSSLRRRLDEEQTKFRELAEHLEKKVKQAEERAEEEKKVADKLRKDLEDARQVIIDKVSHIEDLNTQLKSSVFAIPDSSIEARKVRELEQHLIDANAEINALKTKLKIAKDSAEEYFNVAQSAEKQFKEVLDQEQKYKDEIEAQQKLIKELQDKCEELQGELSIHLDDQDIAGSQITSKTNKLQEELNIRTMNLQEACKELENARSEIKSLNDQLKAVENKYAREVTLHSADLQTLTDLKEELNQALLRIKEVECTRDQVIDELTQNRQTWEEQSKLIYDERDKLEQRFKDMEDQNGLLMDQIQALNNQLTILQSQSSADANTSIGDGNNPNVSLNRSFAEEEVKSSEQLLKVIKYLRQEKDIAVSKADIMEAEHFRLKSQFDALNKQLEEAKAQIEAERQKSEVSVVSSAKHNEVLRKLETLNAITDSNRTLRQERDELLAEITTLRERAEKLETEVAPMQEQNRELRIKSDQMQAENISLRGEATRWRQRANQLIERTNRTSPEDWKKLQTERETLAKQLTIERGNTAKLTDENNNLKQDKTKLEEQLKAIRERSSNQMDELQRLRSEVASFQNQVQQLTQSLEQQTQETTRLTEEVKVLTEDQSSKDVAIIELRNNLAQVKKIAKKYKTQYEDQTKDLESLKQQNEQKEAEQSVNEEKQNQLMEQQRSEHEEKLSEMESSHKETIDQLNQQVAQGQEQLESLRKEIDTLKTTSQEKEEKFKTLFKNAKDRIVSLTEQNNNLREELSRQGKSESSSSTDNSGKIAELLEKINGLQRERDEISTDLQQEKERHTAEIESLNQRITQLQRQLEQQGSKPSTSSVSSEKSVTERPTADIKPMAGHSTNTQTQSVPIQPWRSGGEPTVASIRPMAQQLRTAAVLPTTQTPSAAVVPPHQQVHTTGSSNIEAMSSSPTSSHTDYVPATSSASSAMMGGPKQVAVPPTQSSQDTEDDDSNMQVQQAPQTQTVALVSPRVEPPSSGSGPTQEQGTSSSSSNTVTTTQAGLKRQRDHDTDSCQAEEQPKQQQQSKRTRLQQGVTESGVEVEYQVPTSSQRDHDDDNVIVVESDEEGGADEGEGAGDDQDDPDDAEDIYEGMDQDDYENAECQEAEEEDEGGNEVEVIDDSSEVPNQSENQASPEDEENSNEQQAQSQAISSGTDGTSSSGVVISQASTSHSLSAPPFARARVVPPLPVRQPMILDDCNYDDGIVPSTPTLFPPRRSDRFGEVVSSPHVPSSAPGRFTFNESPLTTHAPVHVPEQSLEDQSTGRSVPTTPLQSSPQESIPNVGDDVQAGESSQSDEIPSGVNEEEMDDDNHAEGSEDAMGPPAGTSSEGGQAEGGEAEGDDEVSSEGEKQPATEDGEEEGREAEASPSTNSRARRGGPSARRSMRLHSPSRGPRTNPPTPIVWGDQRQSPQQLQRNLHGQQGGRGALNYRAVARRARGRIQRPFGGRY